MDQGNRGQHSYLEHQYVRRRLNEIFGHGGWSLQEEVTRIEGTECEYMGKCVIAIPLEGRPEPALYAGHSHGSPIGNRVDHDQALKAAASGALKRAAINLGDQFGLSLYDGDEGVSAPAEPARLTVSDMLGVLDAITGQDPGSSANDLREALKAEFGIDTMQGHEDKLQDVWNRLDGVIGTLREQGASEDNPASGGDADGAWAYHWPGLIKMGNDE